MPALPILLLLIGQSGYAGSPLPAIDAALVVAEVTADDVVVDIGSGDGRVVTLAAKRFGCRAIGIEFDQNLAKLSRQTVLRNRVKRVEIRHEDALKSDLSQATVVYVYHQAGFLAKLRPQIESLEAGTRLVFLDYPPPWLDLEPVRTIKVGEHEHRIYLHVCGVQDDSALVAAARIYPGVMFHRGERDAYLVQLSQECADLLAQRGENAYWFDGHPNWNSRFYRIRTRLGLRGVEVTAFSWPRESEQVTPEIARRLFYDWERSSGHWKVVSRPHKRFGEGLARSTRGVWYGCIIVAD